MIRTESKISAQRFEYESTAVFAEGLHRRMLSHCHDLYDSANTIRQYRKGILTVIDTLPNDYDIAPSATDFLMSCFNLLEKTNKECVTQCWLSVLYEMISMGFVSDEYLGSFVSQFPDTNRDWLKSDLRIIRKSIREGIPLGCLNVHYYKQDDTSQSHQIVVFNTANELIQDVMLSVAGLLYPSRKIHQSFQEFIASFRWDFPDEPATIFDFTPETFHKHCLMFANTDRKQRKALARFYQEVISRQGSASTFVLSSGVNVTFLDEAHCIERYADGFRVIAWNINDPVPVLNKWALMPNGLELAAVNDHHDDVAYLDFTQVNDELLRKALKQWFWEDCTQSFGTRIRYCQNIIRFFEYREHLRKCHLATFIEIRHGVDNIENTILAEETSLFLNDLLSDKQDIRKIRKRLIPINLFLHYLKDNKIYNVEEAAFEYLSTKGGKQVDVQEEQEEDVSTASHDDLSKLAEALNSSAKSSLFNKLCYTIFCLNLLTPLRISSILALRTDSIVEMSRSGLFAVRIPTKTSRGANSNIQISLIAKRLLEDAITHTKQLREQANSDIQPLVFLYEKNKTKIAQISAQSYRVYIKRICREIGIPEYTAQNLRKTYMTTLIENAIKSDISLMTLSKLTGHQSIDTTENYYVKESIRNYLEAMQGIEIGAMDIKGTVTALYEGSNEDLVEEGCGYCQNDECKIAGTASCLMCKGFVTTPEHIPDFEHAIHIISSQMQSSQNRHDREHLYAVKRLYVAYLERLYIEKENYGFIDD